MQIAFIRKLKAFRKEARIKAGIPFEMLDNAFAFVADPDTAQELADTLSAQVPHERLALWAPRFCPVLRHFRSGYHWSLMQVEYATVVVFHRQADFQPLYEAIVRNAVHVIKAEHVANFLGRRLLVTALVIREHFVHPADPGEECALNFLPFCSRFWR